MSKSVNGSATSDRKAHRRHMRMIAASTWKAAAEHAEEYAGSLENMGLSEGSPTALGLSVAAEAARHLAEYYRLLSVKISSEYGL